MSEIPNKQEWLAVSDKKYDQYHNSIDPEKLYKEMTHFFQCSKCNRLLFFWKGFDKSPTFYSKE